MPMPASVQNTIRPRKTAVLDPLARRGGRDDGAVGAHSYTCLYRRTNRIAIAFITSVMTNSVVPTAKIVS